MGYGKKPRGKSKYSLRQRIVSAMTAASFVMQPFGVLAGEITKAGSKDNLIKDNVANIYADKIVGSAAVNTFDKYQLDANQIANMYFTTAQNGTVKDNLVNFVNSRIDVNGTVNAIKGSEIGGNLFFLSSDGMVVGSSGVINAGTLHVLTPTTSAMETLQKNIVTNADTSAVTTLVSDEGWAAIPVNASGTITVLGKVNTVDGANLRAAKIGVGKNVSGDAAFGTAAGGTVTGAVIQSGITDFSNYVNITTAKAEGLTSLTAKQTGSGDIVLSAIATERNEKDSTFNSSATDNNLVHASVDVAAESSVTAAGDVSITATASSGEAYSQYFSDDLVDGSPTETAQEYDLWGQIVKTQADITIDGSVTGETVDIAADSQNYFAAAGLDEGMIDTINAVVGVASINMDAAYAVLGSEANVTVGEKAEITAKGTGSDDAPALSISANSDVKASAGATTTGLKVANLLHSGNIPAAAGAYADTDSSAAVTVNGKLTSAGDMDISADAATSLEVTAINKTTKVGGNGNDNTQFVAAVAIADGSNTSAVTIGDSAELTAAGDLDITAVSTNSVVTEALAVGSETAVASTAVNVTNYDSSADVVVGGTLKGANVNIAAGTTMLENSVTADNTLGLGYFKTGITETAKNSFTGKTITDFFTTLKDHIRKSTPTVGTWVDNLGQYISIGAAVGVVNESTAANVTVNPGASITASGSNGAGDVAITANSTIYDTQMKVVGATNNYGEENKESVLISAAVLYANMDNEASVVIEGDDEGGVTIEGANVTLRANSDFQYNRIDKMLGELLALCEQLEAAYASNDTYKAHAEELAKLAKEYQQKLALDPDYADSTEGNAFALQLAQAAQQVATDASDASVTDQIKDIFVGPLSVVGAAAQFANPSNYANFQAGASTGGKSGDGGASASVAGSVNINDLSNNAKVLIGKGATITADESFKAAATVEQSDVAITGRITINSGGDDAAVGGSVGIHFGETNSVVMVAEGANIRAGSIDLAAENEVTHTGITISAGKSDGAGISGMVSYMSGDSSSIVSVDDEATLAAEAKEDAAEGSSQDGSIRISAENTTVITNIAGGASLGHTAGVGAAVGITDYDVNTIAAISDNDAVTGDYGDDQTDEVKKLIHRAAGLLNDEDGLQDSQGLLGSADKAVADAEIRGSSLDVNASNDSVINTVTIAGGVVTGSDSDEPGIGDEVNNFISNTTNKVSNLTGELDSFVNAKLTGTVEEVVKKNTDQAAKNPNVGANLPSVTVSGAGSVSVNFNDSVTTALVDNVNITIDKAEGQEEGGVSVAAEDSSFIGAWSGAAAVSWKQLITQDNWNNTSVAISGAAAVNDTSTSVVSQISNANITNADYVKNQAIKSGALVSAGLAAALAKGGQGGGSNYSVTPSLSINLSDNDISALMDNVTVENTDDDVSTAVINNALDNDTQVTGGVNVNLNLGGESGVGVGASIGVTDISNTVSSVIRGGSYEDVDTVDVNALSDLTQIGISVGIAAGAGSYQGTSAFEGVASYNELTNKVTAGVDGAAISASSVSVAAQDMDLGEKKYDEYITNRGLDATGEAYMQTISDTAKDLHDDNGNLKVGQTGNLIVTGSLGVAASAGGGSAAKGSAGAAAISVSKIDNDFSAYIKDSTITASGKANEEGADVSVFAKSDTLVVDAAAGGAGSTAGITGAGSVAGLILDNDVTASIDNSTISADSVAVDAISSALAVSVAGQVSAGKTAVGLAVAFNDIDNTTGAYIRGSTINPYDYEKDKNGTTDITVSAENASKIYAIGAGVTAATGTVAANGTVAVNIGQNNTEAIIDEYVDENGSKKGTTLTNVNDLTVSAKDTTGLFALAGGVGVSTGSAAVGGAVAYNQVGELASASDPKTQGALAQVNNTTITTAKDEDEDPTISVSASDESDLKTIAVGVGVTTGNASVQGAAATAQTNKNTEASLTGTTITAVDGALADVDVSAESHSSTITSAGVVAVGNNAAIGAGVSVNRTENDVAAYVSGGTYQVEDLAVNAASEAMIETVGVGGSVSANASVTGSVAVNQIYNDVTAAIKGGANVTADNNVIVAAQSDELISNYAGSASVAGTGAAVGLSVSVNQIDSQTTASIEGENTKVTAHGKGSAATVKDSVSDDDIADAVVEGDLFDGTGSLADDRKESAYSGVAVSASSTHTIKSFLVNAGVAGTGAAVNGTVNVNTIDGATEAKIDKATITSGTDVNVAARDYTNSYGLVGSASVGGTGAGVGLGSDTNTVSRDVTAAVSDTRITADDAFAVAAEAKQGISSLALGIGAAGMGAGVANGTSVALLDGATTARVTGSTITAGSVDVTAEHLSRINTAAAAVAGAGGVGAGIGGSVVNEESDTAAEVSDTSILIQGTTEADQDVNITADNTTEINYQLYSAGGGIGGVAGAIGVSNIESTVTTKVDDVTVGKATDYVANGVTITAIEGAAKNINIGAANHLDFTNYSGSLGAGAVGVGVGVSVNTIDSQVNTVVDGSTLYASNDLNVTASEDRTVSQVAVNAAAGSVAGGVNVMITNVGSAVEGAYGENLQSDEDGNVKEGSQADIKQYFDAANEALSQNSLGEGYTLGAFDESSLPGSATAGMGGEQESMVKVSVSDSDMIVGGKATISAKETTNVTMTGVQAGVGASANVSGTVGILDVHRNSGVEITDTNIAADALAITTTLGGVSELDIYQGTVGGAASIGAAYGSATSGGVTGIGISGSTFTTEKDLEVSASDESQTEVNAIGVTVAAGGAASVVVAQGTNKGETTISIDGSDLTAGGDMDISAARKAVGDSLSVHAILGTGGLLFAGTGLGATANEFGTVGVSIGKNSASSLIAGGSLDISAVNAPSVTVDTTSAAVSLVAGAAISVAEANIGSEDDHLETYVTVENGSTLGAGSGDEEGISITASANAQQTVDMFGLSLGGYASAQGNGGTASVYSDVQVTIGGNTTFLASDDGAVDVDIDAKNNVVQNLTAQGISVGGYFGTGTNIGTTESYLKTAIDLQGSSKDSQIDDLTASASSYAKVSNAVEGDGGSLVDLSPYAAKANNIYQADTDVTISGSWTTAGGFAASAVNDMDIDVSSDATRAAVVGGSGTWLSNVINNAADILVNGATIVTEGAQSYTAQNQVDYVGALDGNGYGGLNVNATDYSDDLDFNANITFKDSTLTGAGDAGSITALAATVGTIESTNDLASAGVVPISLAFSEHAIDYHNAVTVENSDFSTEKKNMSITLAAYDDMEVTLQTIANTQGGLVGAASVELANTLNRSNKISITGDSTFLSSHDANFYAGANANGVNSSLDLIVAAEAYNKTGIPVYTAPKLENNMSQANQVSIGEDAAVESVRHINMSASKGGTTLSKSVKEYRLWTGDAGSGGTVASTTLGESIGDEKTDNYVDIDGTVTAGVHNNLTIEITGNITTEEPTYWYDENGNPLFDEDDNPIITGGDVSNTISASAKEDWFDTSSIVVGETKVENSLITRYKEISKVIGDYDEGTSERALLQAELDSLIEAMKNMGMVTEVKDKDGNVIAYVPDESLYVVAVELPDIVVSGGNINIDSDELRGDGTLTAQAAGDISITNRSDAYLIVNDVTMADTGGQIKFNKADLADSAAGNNFGGSTNAESASGDAPTITISGTAAGGKSENGLQPDIAIMGDLTNTAGDITVSNSNYNITILGNISGRNVAIKADYGNVTQMSTEGISLVGGDPVTKYQFNEKVAAAIQEYIYDQMAAADAKGETYTIPTFDSYDEYKNWIITNIVGSEGKNYGITESDLSYEYDPTENTIVAGGSVYISGVNVNIGGLVQSGFSDYSVNLDEAAAQKVADLDAAYAANPGALTNDQVMSNDAYCINGGGAVYNPETGVYDYTIKVYYNPSTGELLTDSVNVSGGSIYITGAISSTGNGRIVAADGAADISINTTAVDRDVVVNSITNNDVTGYIRLTDTAKGTVTEYQNGTYRQYTIGETGGDWLTGSGDYTYSPEEGLQYQWVSGVSGEIIKKYVYTKKFLFWGGLTYGTADEVLADMASQGLTLDDIIVDTQNSGESTGKGGGVVIGKGDNTNDFSITGSYQKKDNETRTDPVRQPIEYDGFWGKIFGYGTVDYEFSGKQGTSSSTTTSVAADKDISIGFIGSGANKNVSGSISVTTSGDMTIAGNISNAEVDGKALGGVSLDSVSGSVTTKDNVYINADDLTISAATGIDVSHAAIGESATIDLSTDKGNISFASGAGDIYVEQAVTGGNGDISASTGNVFLEAYGSILNGNTDADYVVKGQRIDLVSQTGSIGTMDQALTIQGGSELYSSDSMASSVNAQAAGDIVLTQASGNMRIGTIASSGGDAYLTVLNGSFVDAHPEENSDSSTAQQKIDRWMESGLINADDAANESAAAAAEAKEQRLEAIEGQLNILAEGNADKVSGYKEAAAAYAASEAMQEAKSTYLEAVLAAGGDTEAINAAYEAYQAAQAEYFADMGYSEAEQQAIVSYAEISESDNYGWSQNELLYAIQDSVINSDPGDVLTVETPNVTANNITLIAENGGVGIDGADVVISYDDLSDVDNLKILAAAKAGDLTWDEENQQVIVRQQQAITVHVTGADGDGNATGEVNVNGRDNVYLAGVKDTTLNITGVKTEGDIKLQGDAGVQVVGDGKLVGQDLTIAGGTGTIGSADNYVQTQISGSLDANAEGSIYISQEGDLHILTVATGEEANLTATENIYMADVEGSLAQGYINAAEVNLVAGAGIGTEDTAIRILDNGAVVNASAENDIYLSGVTGSTTTEGSLVLGEVTGSDITVSSVSDIHIGRDGDEDEEVVGRVTADDGSGTITIIAEGGSITETEKSAILAGTLDAQSTGSQSFHSANNVISRYEVTGLGEGSSLTGGIDFVTNTPDGLTADLNGVTVHDGGVSIINLADGDLTVEGESLTTTGDEADVNLAAGGAITSDIAISSGADITMTAGGAITNTGSLTAEEDVDLTTSDGAISTTGSITAGNNVNVSTEAGAVSIGGTVTAEEGQVDITTGSGSITTDGSISAGTDVTVNTESGTVSVSGDVTANGDVFFHTGMGEMTIDGAVTAVSGEVNIDSGSGSITTDGTITAGTNVAVTTEEGEVSLGGSVTADDDVFISSGEGDVTVSGSVSAGAGQVDITTGSGSVTTDGSISAGTDVTVNTDSGTVSVSGDVTANGDVFFHTGMGEMTIDGAVTAVSGEVNIDSGSGSITTDGTITAGTNVAVTTEDGEVSLGGSVTADDDVLISSGEGDVTVSGSVSAGAGQVDITTGSGSITTDGAVSAGTDVTVNTESGTVSIGGDVTAQDSVLVNTGSGDVTLDGNVTSVTEGTHITSGSGAILVDGLVTSGDEFIASTTNGDVTINGSVNAAGDVLAEVTGTGNITTGTGAEVNGRDITFTTNTGHITTGSSLTADEDVLLNTDTGDITLGGDVTASDGNITININEAGSLADAEGTDNTLAAFSPTGDESKGHVYINIKGPGDVDLNEIFADHSARLDVADGNVKIVTIDGELVAIQTRTEGNEVDVDNINAGSQIIVSGSDINLDQISQRPDSDGMLVITVEGASPDQPISNLVIGNLQTSADSGVRFDHLWVENADVHISQGQLWFDQLYVENVGHFSNDHTVVGVYGSAPIRDGSDAVFWIDTSLNRPEANLDSWLGGAGDWMYLRLVDDHTILSNGHLLMLDEYDYVYNQRITTEDHLRDQLARYVGGRDGAVLYDRYDLIEDQEETTASDGEVTVEL